VSKMEFQTVIIGMVLPKWQCDLPIPPLESCHNGANLLWTNLKRCNTIVLIPNVSVSSLTHQEACYCNIAFNRLSKVKVEKFIMNLHNTKMEQYILSNDKVSFFRLYLF